MLYSHIGTFNTLNTYLFYVDKSDMKHTSLR